MDTAEDSNHDSGCESILESIKTESRLFLEYLTKLYCLNLNGKPIPHQCILFHSNKVCLITLAPSHPIHLFSKTVTSINYECGQVNRLQNKVTGRRKKGGQKLQSTSVLCTLKCSDDSTYDVFSCVQGLLIEMNENLIENPQCCATHPFSNGYIAIVMLDLSGAEEMRATMLTQTEYIKEIESD